VSIGALGAGQLGAPGRNYFLGDISAFHFDGFTIGGKTIATPEAAWLEFAPGAGEGFKLNGKPITAKPALSAPEPKAAANREPAPQADAAPEPPVATGTNLLVNPRSPTLPHQEGWSWRNSENSHFMHAKLMVPAGAYVEQDVTDAMLANGTGNYHYWARVSPLGDWMKARVVLIIEDDSGAHMHPAPDAELSPGSSSISARTHNLKWINLKRALFRVEALPGSGHFVINACGLTK
jgi:hypothetical protein